MALNALGRDPAHRRNPRAQPLTATKRRAELCYIIRVRQKYLIVISTVVSLATLACTQRARRPDGPYREAQELTDALSDELVTCVRKHTPPGTGEVVIAAELTPVDQAPIVHDLGSAPGSDAVVACLQASARAKLHNPHATPAPYVRIRVPLPLVTAELTYTFLSELPAVAP
jgi:hypothetical protein